jgi:hypothetical protein
MPPKIGDVDDLEVLLGQRGTGKTTFMEARARQLVRQYGGAYVIGHSLGRRLVKQLPAELGGHTIPVHYYPTIKKLAEGLRTHPERWHILAPPTELEAPAGYYDKHVRETADDLIAFGVRLSTHLRLRAYKKAHPLSFARDISKLDLTGLPCTPIVLLVDEGVAVEGAGKSQTKEEQRAFKEWLFSLRHLHTALLWSIQDPTARGWNIMGQATWIRVFHVQHEYALQAIRAAGADESQLEQIEAQYAYEHVDIRVSARKRPAADAKPPAALPEKEGEVKTSDDKSPPGEGASKTA